MKLTVEGQDKINHRFGLGLEQKSLITFSDSRSLIYSHDSTHTIRKTDLTVKHGHSNCNEGVASLSDLVSHSNSKFELNRYTFPLVIAVTTGGPDSLERAGKTVTFLQIDPRNKRQLLIGYDDGMAEILDSNNFQSVVFSTE